MSESDEYNGHDGVLWDVYIKETKKTISKELETMVYNFNDRDVKPGDLGYKYNILTVKNKQAEFTSAYIGDVESFVVNQARAGWSGLMVKIGVVPKTTIKKMFKVILNNSKFDNKQVRLILAQV